MSYYTPGYSSEDEIRYQELSEYLEWRYVEEDLSDVLIENEEESEEAPNVQENPQRV